jgi:hypothetical protein
MEIRFQDDSAHKRKMSSYPRFMTAHRIALENGHHYKRFLQLIRCGMIPPAAIVDNRLPVFDALEVEQTLKRLNIT